MMCRTLARRCASVLAIAATFAAIACGPKNAMPPGTQQPDVFLMERGKAEMAAKHWLKARTYFQQIVDNYPQSPLRPEAKLSIGDTYLGENSLESVVLAANEFKEFLNFYPTSSRADYAQYKLAMSHYAKMRAPERDQTETREAVKEFAAFFERYPNSELMPEVRQKWRDARDRLTQSSVNVGIFYFRSVKFYPGAISRLREALAEDPEFSNRDSVYYYLAESLARTDKKAEAIPYFDRLLTEFPNSEFAPEAKRRLDELSTSMGRAAN